MRRFSSQLTFLYSLIVLSVFAGGVGCGSARVSHQELDDSFKAADFAKSSELAKKGIAEQGENGRDLLLYLLDGALSLAYEGKWDESNQLLARADAVSEIKDYTSLTEESGSILTGENLKDYKGEEFETVLINVFKMINYAQMGNTESALVEARVTHRKLRRLREEAKRNYLDNAFAEYLSGVLYEAEGEYNDAYISYKKVAQLEPRFLELGKDLYRTAWLSRFHEEAQKYAALYQLTDEQKREEKRHGQRLQDHGELIVIVENGLSPIKAPNPQWQSLPMFQPRWNPMQRAIVRVDDAGAGAITGTTASLFDIEKAAIQNLDQKYAALVAKRVVGVVAKEVISYQVERQTNNPALGMLTRIILHSTDQADLRSWRFLPKNLQIYRIWLPAGKHSVQVSTDPIGVSITGSELNQKVEIRPKKKAFLRFRILQK